MTPAEKLGYKVGDEFTYNDNRWFKKGEVINLVKDDGTEKPEFSNGIKARWISVDQVSPAPITLRPGDYVSTKGMTEDEYHAVAQAFMAAGAEENEYDKDDKLDSDTWRLFGWEEDVGLSYWDNAGTFADDNRQLTLSQILNATNAGNSTHAETTTEATPMHLTDRLEAARITLEAAQAEYDALLEEHKAAYPKLHGLIVQVDIPPEEWRAGDVVECIDDSQFYITKGSEYKVTRALDGFDDIEIMDNDGDESEYDRLYFRFVSRP